MTGASNEIRCVCAVRELERLLAAGEEGPKNFGQQRKHDQKNKTKYVANV
jgi:hypothetical protein